MEKLRFEISTLHRGRYMLIMMGLVLGLVLAASKIPVSEITKILTSLFLIPFILFIAVKSAKNPSIWSIEQDNLMISDKTKTKTIALSEISHIRNLKRSGGNLIIITLKNKSNYRTWRNKLFQAEDDLRDLAQTFKDLNIEYYDL